MVDTPVGNVRGVPPDVAADLAAATKSGTVTTFGGQQIPVPVVVEPLSPVAQPGNNASLSELVELAQEMVLSMVGADTTQMQAVVQRRQALQDLYRLIEVKQSLQ